MSWHADGYSYFGCRAIRNLQAQLALHKIERLRALEGEADWSDFAVLGRTHETLEPIRAYCELHGISYRTGERSGSGLSAVKTREGHALLGALRRRSGRLIPARALFRWIAARARLDGARPDPSRADTAGRRSRYAGRRPAQHRCTRPLPASGWETHSISSSARFGMGQARRSGGWRRAMPAGSYARRGESERHRSCESRGDRKIKIGRGPRSRNGKRCFCDLTFE